MRPPLNIGNANPLLRECPTVQSRLARLWDRSRDTGWVLRDLANTIKRPAAEVLRGLHQLREAGKVKLAGGRWFWTGEEVRA